MHSTAKPRRLTQLGRAALFVLLAVAAVVGYTVLFAWVTP